MSQGLRIAPPEAPVSGYAYGKGVYFADQLALSAGYTRYHISNKTGLLLLCQVALGNQMFTGCDCNLHTKVIKSKNFDSATSQGGGVPNPKDDVIKKEKIGGKVQEYKVPLGKTNNGGYSQFMVYNTDQIMMKYLIRIKFTN